MKLAGIELVVENKEYLHKSLPAVFLCNHQTAVLDLPIGCAVSNNSFFLLFCLRVVKVTSSSYCIDCKKFFEMDSFLWYYVECFRECVYCKRK